jgi:hypothetical protein
LAESQIAQEVQIMKLSGLFGGKRKLLTGCLLLSLTLGMQLPA